ncbi:FCD domain-containing protein [Streptomyces sp. NBC_01314]|uniref:FCD domain-containing protein n=1 Tax=Streptomyces sp. NBC_01314 TaxID=2903821 RepID=UPI00308A7A52|nr:FCD domain-containing protein [Streptomyces sp. NBC_01314]
MLLQVLSTRTQRVRIVRGSRTRRALDQAHQDHEAILAALQARDGPLAVSTTTVHIAVVEQWLAGKTLPSAPLRRGTPPTPRTDPARAPPRGARKSRGRGPDPRETPCLQQYDHLFAEQVDLFQHALRRINRAEPQRWMAAVP